MTWNEILQRRKEVEREADAYDARIAQAESQLANPGPDASVPVHLGNLKAEKRQRTLEINSLSTELQMRPALSFGCLCFVLVGCPVGIWFSRSDYLSAFITCFLPIVFLYYPLLLCTTNFAKQGQVPPVLSLWAANTVMVLIALVLFRKLLRN